MPEKGNDQSNSEKKKLNKFDEQLKSLNLLRCLKHRSFYDAVAYQCKRRGKHFFPENLKLKVLQQLNEEKASHQDERVHKATADLLKYTIRILCFGQEEEKRYEPKEPKIRDGDRSIMVGWLGNNFYSLSRDIDSLNVDDAKDGGEEGKKEEGDISDTDEEGDEIKNDFVHYTEEESQKTEGAVQRLGIKLAKYTTVLVFGGAVVLGGITTKSTLLVLGNAYSQSYSASTCPSVGGHHYYTRYMVMLILMSCLCVPEVLALLFGLWQSIRIRNTDSTTSQNKTNGMKENKKKESRQFQWLPFLLGMIPEVLNAVGLTFMTLFVIPKIDSTLASLIFSLIAIIPAILHLPDKFASMRDNPETKNSHENEAGSPEQGEDDQRKSTEERKKLHFVLSVLAIILLPTGYGLACWQVYGEDESGKLLVATLLSLLCISTRYWENFISQPTKSFQDANSSSKNLQEFRFETTTVYAIVRMAVIVACCFIIHFVIEGNQATVAYKGFQAVYFHDEPRLSRKCSEMISSFWYAGITNIFCSFGTFFFGMAACKSFHQIPAFTFPLASVTPIVTALTSAYNFGGARKGISLMDFFKLAPQYSFVNEFIGWKTTYVDVDSGMFAALVVAGILTGFLGLLFITSFLWKDPDKVMEKVEGLFVKPIFSGPMINEEMMLNRRQYSASGPQNMVHKPDFDPYLYLCATMWHEEENEMKKLLTSIMRLDKKTKKELEFNFEVHILFDDAFEQKGISLNKYVKNLMRVVEEAADTVSNGDGKKLLATQAVTPYGGRITVYTPGDHVIFVHLKDKRKIRNGKRWSQCMYMYYILKYLPQFQPDTNKTEETFILALDGDVDFYPSAVTYLLDRMKIDKWVGAACGRIHPIGSGPVVWFQKFEYAVGHWLQKTAEDVLGCVLCSPGCFSLFRGEALLCDNVVGTYTKEAVEEKHKIQWDQGEDRWLCTLLLKQRYRIEYSAASDSYTFAPEDFKEFYKQRRRWAPSTIANIFDLLLDAKRVVKNPYISWGYIIYQIVLMFSSILGSSIVILVIQGSLQYVYGMSAVGALMVAVIPVVIYVVICIVATEDTQISFARILTLLYALVMLTVLVGILAQLATSLLNPGSVLMLSMIAIFAITGILHPLEITCLFHGLLYYLCVPSAFIFLPIYSYCNMHVTSWGTRESPKKQDDNGPSGDQDSPDKGNYGCGIGTFCRCTFCVNPYEPVPTSDPQLQIDENEENLQLNEDEKSKVKKKKRKTFADAVRDVQRIKKLRKKATFLKVKNLPKKGDHVEAVDAWFDDKEKEIPWDCFEGILANKIPDLIETSEQKFWEAVMKQHLWQYKKEEAAKKKEDLAPKLKVLRNRMAGAYLFINSLWLTLTFTLTVVIEDVNITLYDKNGNKALLNPIAFLFMIFFLVVFITQFITMLIHRWDTFLHLIGNTRSSHQSESQTGKGNEKKDQNKRPGASGTTNSAFRGTSRKMSHKRVQGNKIHPASGTTNSNPRDDDDRPGTRNVPRVDAPPRRRRKDDATNRPVKADVHHPKSIEDKRNPTPSQTIELSTIPPTSKA